MTSAMDAMLRLDALASELDDLSRGLADVERRLEPVDAEYTRFVDDYELGIYHRSLTVEGFKLPSEALRSKLAIAKMPPELYGRRVALVRSRDRMVQRIKDIKVQVEAQRSVLSALKLEAEASGAGLGRQRYESVNPRRAT